MGKPKRGYSWPPFAEGNEAALKHGAYSEARWGPVAERLEADLLAERPWLTAHGRTVSAWARVEAQAMLLTNFLDVNGLLNGNGEPWPCSNRLDRLESLARSLRVDLAETPMAMARLLDVLTSAAATVGAEDTLEHLHAEGRVFLEAYLARAGAAMQQLPSAPLSAAPGPPQAPDAAGDEQ